jgi:hypothetical protein
MVGAVEHTGPVQASSQVNFYTLLFMQATAKTAMRRVLGIRGGQGETLVPTTAVAGGDEGLVFEFEASDNNNSG